MKYKSDFKKYCKYEDGIYKNILFVCLLFCLFVCLFDFCHKNDLNYKLNILGPLCLWQCLGKYSFNNASPSLKVVGITLFPKDPYDTFG